MQRIRLLLVALVMVLVFAVGLTIGLSVRHLVTAQKGPQMTSTATVLRQVQTLSQLVTVKYVMEKVVVFEDIKWFGENRVLLLAHGVVKAGVDLTQLQGEDIEVKGRSITIHLPASQISDAYLDDKQTRVIERTTGLLRLFDKDLEQNARQIAVDDIRRAARIAGIQKDADERAKLQLTVLLHQMGFEQVEIVSRKP